ncbi:MAG: low molecular weight protein-tyrosine-phosphatase [Leptospirales bacterium]|jgi:protein-tyrosine phosphatase
MSASTENSIGVLFVCLGNICRSPAAEGAFAHAVAARSMRSSFRIDSCGTSAYHIGERANATSRATARRYGIELTSRARQFTIEDFDRFDYIFAMDGSNYSEICALARDAADLERVWKFRAFDPEFRNAMAVGGRVASPGDAKQRNALAPDVPDPYYGGPEGFEEVQRIMLRTSERLLDWLGESHALAAKTK